MNTSLKKLKRFVAKNRLFSIVLVLFVLFTSYYAVHSTVNTTPDESYHYAAIKTYSRQFSPLVTRQGDISESNDMIRYPSYLYHYIFSFPYRLFAQTSLSDRSILVVLRLMNVVLGVIVLFSLRRLLIKLTAKRIADITVLLFALVPMTLIIYGGLNYDNLLLLLTFLGVELLLSLWNKPNLQKAFGVAILLMLGSLTKFSFLPVLLTVGAVFAFVCYKKWRNIFTLPKKITAVFIVICASFIIVFGLFIERYGVNVVTYRSVNPSCKVAHSVEKCNTFPINLRNETAAASGISGDQPLPIFAVDTWMRYMVEGSVHPVNKDILRYVIVITMLLFTTSVLAWRKLGYTHKNIGTIVLMCAGTYVIILFINNWNIYQSLGQPLAINGRYILPALPFLLVPGIASFMFGANKLFGRLRGNNS